MLLHPVFYLGLCHADNILGRVDGSLSAAYVQEVQALGRLVQVFLVTGGIAQLAEGISLDQRCGLSVVCFLADDHLHGTNLLYC